MLYPILTAYCYVSLPECKYTLPKFNIAPKNGWLEYYFPIGKVTFQGRTVKLREGKPKFLLGPQNSQDATSPVYGSAPAQLIQAHFTLQMHRLGRLKRCVFVFAPWRGVGVGVEFHVPIFFRRKIETNNLHGFKIA